MPDNQQFKEKLADIMKSIDVVGKEQVVFPSNKIMPLTLHELLQGKAPVQDVECKYHVLTRTLALTRKYVDKITAQCGNTSSAHHLYGVWFTSGFGECSEQTALALLELDKQNIFPFVNVAIMQGEVYAHNFLLVHNGAIKKKDYPDGQPVSLDQFDESVYAFDMSLRIIVEARHYLTGPKVQTYLKSVNCVNPIIQPQTFMLKKLAPDVINAMHDFSQQFQPLKDELTTRGLFGSVSLDKINPTNFKTKLATLIFLEERMVRQFSFDSTYIAALKKELTQITASSGWSCPMKTQAPWLAIADQAEALKICTHLRMYGLDCSVEKAKLKEQWVIQIRNASVALLSEIPRVNTDLEVHNTIGLTT